VTFEVAATDEESAPFVTCSMPRLPVCLVHYLLDETVGTEAQFGRCAGVSPVVKTRSVRVQRCDVICQARTAPSRRSRGYRQSTKWDQPGSSPISQMLCQTFPCGKPRSGTRDGGERSSMG
jgi:hypothetical protein